MVNIYFHYLQDFCLVANSDYRFDQHFLPESIIGLPHIWKTYSTTHVN